MCSTRFYPHHGESIYLATFWWRTRCLLTRASVHPCFLQLSRLVERGHAAERIRGQSVQPVRRSGPHQGYLLHSHPRSLLKHQVQLRPRRESGECKTAEEGSYSEGILPLSLEASVARKPTGLSCSSASAPAPTLGFCISLPCSPLGLAHQHFDVFLQPMIGGDCGGGAVVVVIIPKFFKTARNSSLAHQAGPSKRIFSCVRARVTEAGS